MQYKIKATGEVFHERMLGEKFPNTSFPPVLSVSDLAPLDLEEVPDPVPPPPTLEELEAQAMVAAKAKQDAILQGMTALFDQTAQSHHYDNRITCALRAGYPGPFHAEGVVFATWMDVQNAKAYAMLAQVEAGTLPMPESVEAALALLDPIVWPA